MSTSWRATVRYHLYRNKHVIRVIISSYHEPLHPPIRIIGFAKYHVISYPKIALDRFMGSIWRIITGKLATRLQRALRVCVSSVSRQMLRNADFEIRMIDTCLSMNILPYGWWKTTVLTEIIARYRLILRRMKEDPLLLHSQSRAYLERIPSTYREWVVSDNNNFDTADYIR